MQFTKLFANDCLCQSILWSKVNFYGTYQPIKLLQKPAHPKSTYRNLFVLTICLSADLFEPFVCITLIF